MPKTRYDKYARTPVDRLKAIVLERMDALELTQEDVAALIGVSSSTVSNWLRASASKWPLEKVLVFMKATKVPFEDFAAAIRY